jgi:hypothetical protein
LLQLLLKFLTSDPQLFLKGYHISIYLVILPGKFLNDVADSLSRRILEDFVSDAVVLLTHLELLIRLKIFIINLSCQLVYFVNLLRDLSEQLLVPFLLPSRLFLLFPAFLINFPLLLILFGQLVVNYFYPLLSCITLVYFRCFCYPCTV